MEFGVAPAQLSTSAYRALGQPDLRQNGVNMVRGMELNAPSGLALDARDGLLHLYVADTRNHRIMAWRDARSFQRGAPADLVLAQPSPQHVGAFGIGARGLRFPLRPAVDPRTGNLYVTDFGNSRILRFPRPFGSTSRIEPDAVYGQPNFTTFDPNSSGITDHTLAAPSAVTFDSQGNLWVADTGNHRVLRFPAAVLDAREPRADLVVGQANFTAAIPNHGVANPLSPSGLESPVALAFDQQNNLYVSDFANARVLRFSAPFINGMEATLVYGQADLTMREIPPQASASILREGPAGLAADAAGNLYVSVPQEHRVLVFAAGSRSGAPAARVIGQPNFTSALPNTGVFPRASDSTFFGVNDLKVDADGNVFVTDAGNNRALAFAAGSSSANRVWGQADLASNGANQIKPGSINSPYKIAVDYSQSPFALYVSDTNNHRVLVWRDVVRFATGGAADLVIGQPDLVTALPNVDTRGTFIPSSTSLTAPRGIMVDDRGTLYVADSGNSRVLRYPRPVSQTGRITPDAVLGQRDFSSATSSVVNDSSLREPSGVALGPNGNLFVADSGNHRVLEFPSGAGTGASATRVYGQPNFTSRAAPTTASAQSLLAPQGILVDAAFNLLVADFGAHRVLLFPNTRNAPTTGASASIVIGQERFNTSAPDLAPNRLTGPVDVALDSRGNIYVSDSGSHRILVFPSLLFLPAAGAAARSVVGQLDTADGRPNWNTPDGLATAEGLFFPAGIYLDRQDTLYVGDTGNNRVVHFLKGAAAVNAAHFQESVPVAPGALTSLFAAGLTDQTQQADALPLPLALAGREVVVNDTLRAPLLFVSPGQINLQLPAGTPPGAQRIAVRVAETGELVAGGSLAVAAFSPAFLTASQDGRGQGVILNQDSSTNSPANPAARGSVVTLFGTGQGPVSPAVADGEAAPTSPLATTVAVPTSDGATCLISQPSLCVAIGSTFGEILYSGLAPGFVGLWQLNVRIPANALADSAIPVRALINTTPSNIITMAIR